MNKLMKISIMTGAIVLGMSSSIAMANFNDIDENNYYLLPITTLSEKGVISGYPDNTFKPANKVTRAEFAKMISIAEELKINENNKLTFEDVDAHWSKIYVELAASNRLLKGYEDGSFKPDKEITYGEVATILLRTLNIYEISDSNTNWPEDCMNYAAKIGLFNGVATNDLLGMNPARRDNVALMIYNKLNLESYYEDLFSGDKDSTLSGDNNESEEVKNDNEKENNEKEDIKNDNQENTVNIDTKKLYNGTVELITKRRGETFVTIKEFDGTEREIKVKDAAKVPEVHTLLFYKINSKGNVTLKKQLPIDDANKNYFLVEDVDNELIKLKDEANILDFEKATVELSGETYKLNKYSYFIAEVVENEDNVYEYSDVNSFSKEDLKFKKEDRIVIDAKAKIVVVIRGIEEI